MVLRNKNSRRKPKRVSRKRSVLISSRDSGVQTHKGLSIYAGIVYLLSLLLVDRITKFWAMTIQYPYDAGWIAFRFVTNTGAGFSILQDQNALLTWIAIIALGLIIYFHHYFPRSGLILLVAGLVGNLLDRITYGAVIDFIDLKFWPVFNMADSYISIGVIITILWHINSEYKTRLKKK
jgi:signal peptidase II